MRLFTVIFVICLGVVHGAEVSIQSRAIQNFGCNCAMNRYLQEELILGLQYLSASVRMKHDSVAMRGFGKLFGKFWHTQLDNANNIRKYTIRRGGVAETPYIWLRNDPADHFSNITSIVHKFLDAEKYLNKKLLDLHGCTSDNSVEITCREDRKYKKYYKNSSFSKIEDPLTADYLDGNFIGQKVDRIKYLADMLKSLLRFHMKHPIGNGAYVDLGLNPIGVHLVDHDLETTL